MNTMLTALVCSIIAAVATSIISILPGLHIYNILGLIIVIMLQNLSDLPAPYLLIPTATAMISAYCITTTIPAILLAAPDESAIHTVLPGQSMLFEGKGRIAIELSAAGGVGAALILLITMPLMPHLLPTIQIATQEHMHWMIWCIALFMILSEWPKPLPPGLKPIDRIKHAWRSLAVGILVFALSGLLGLILFTNPPLPARHAFQNLLPGFVGLFAIPGLLMNIMSKTTIPPQKSMLPFLPDPHALAQGITAGCLGGGFAAFAPAITGGVGGWLAGHATAQYKRDVFLIAQGANRLAYYAGGFMLFFVPQLNLARGGAASMFSTLHLPASTESYWFAGAGVALGVSVGLLMLNPLCRFTLYSLQKWGYHRISLLTMVIATALVAFFGGLGGLMVMLVATGIGTLPLLYGCRRMNALGIIIIPIATNLSGIPLAQWLNL